MSTEILYVEPDGGGYHRVLLIWRGSQLSYLRGNLLFATRADLRGKRGARFISSGRGGTEVHDLAQRRLIQIKYSRCMIGDHIMNVSWSGYLAFSQPMSQRSYVSEEFSINFHRRKRRLDNWQNMMRSPVQWLLWGSDVLGLGSASGTRSYDLHRPGRQPQDGDDDFQQRPPAVPQTYGFILAVI